MPGSETLLIFILCFIHFYSFYHLFGVIVIDYYFVKDKQLVSKDIFSLEKNSLYFYSNGWHIKGIYSSILGFIFAASTIWNENLMSFHSYSWIIGAFISSLTYYLLIKK